MAALEGQEKSHTVPYATEFQKITIMVTPETIRIFQSSMALLIAQNIFESISKILKHL